MSEEVKTLHSWFPFTKLPFICSAPMRTVSGPELAVAVSMAGGLGFIGAGYALEILTATLSQSSALLKKSGAPITDLLPIGVGFLPWNCAVSDAIQSLKQYPPCAVWLFGTASTAQLIEWIDALKQDLPRTKIFIQVGSVKEAKEALLQPNHAIDVLVIQGVADSGGHGLVRGASVMTLLPEVIDLISDLKSEGGIPKERVIPVLATGGIMDGRAVAASLVLGAHGTVIGTRLIASDESEAHPNFKSHLLNAHDGGQNTIRTRLYDNLRGVGNWPQQYNGRGIINSSFHDNENGVDEEINKKRYEEALENNDFERLTAYAGTGVGLIKDIKPAGKIIEEAREMALGILGRQ